MITWKAIYNDGSCLTQYNADGTENRYEDIDRYKLSRFDLYKNADIDKTPFYSLYLRHGQRLIFRRRNFISTNGERHMIIIVGWQKTYDTKPLPTNATAINYIYEDGSIALDDSRNNLQLIPEEDY